MSLEVVLQVLCLISACDAHKNFRSSRNLEESQISNFFAAAGSAEGTGAPAPSGWRLLRWMGRQFCGLEASGPQAEAEAAVLAKVTSLRQNPRVRRVQTLLLASLLTFSATLITLLSVPSGPFAAGYEPLTKATSSYGSSNSTASSPRE